MSLRWAVVGAARIAREQVVPAIARSGESEVLAVSSASGRGAEFVTALGLERSYASHQDLLADPDVDAVYIALPNAHHVQWICAALEAGKHVLCEKPLVLNAEELARVESAARASGTYVAEAFMYRHHAQQQRLQEVLASGEIGDLVHLQARLHFTMERTAEPDIRLRPDLGGGSLHDLGCYPVDLFSSLVDSDPDCVTGVGQFDGPTGVDVRFAGSLRYGAVTASLDCSFDAPFTNTAAVIGTRGRVELTDAFRADRHQGVALLTVTDADERSRQERLVTDQYAEQIRAFERDVVAEQGLESEHWLRTCRTARTVERLAAAADLSRPR